MMKTDKTFDCVKMKDEIQEKLRLRWQGLSGQELIGRMKRDIDESNSPIAEWWRHLEKKPQTTAHKSTLAH
jgi:hypothetical protein